MLVNEHFYLLCHLHLLLQQVLKSMSPHNTFHCCQRQLAHCTVYSVHIIDAFPWRHYSVIAGRIHTDHDVILRHDPLARTVDKLDLAINFLNCVRARINVNQARRS
jgi:hypothetical protein